MIDVNKIVSGLNAKVIDAECATFKDIGRLTEPAFYTGFEDHKPVKTNHEPRVSIYKGSSLDAAIDEINELRKENAELKEKLKRFEWQPIDTVRDRPSCFVLGELIDDGGICSMSVVTGWYDDDKKCWYADDWNDECCGCQPSIIKPTHWMPLPLPPEGK